MMASAKAIKASFWAGFHSSSAFMTCGMGIALVDMMSTSPAEVRQMMGWLWSEGVLVKAKLDLMKVGYQISKRVVTGELGGDVER